MSAEFAVGQHIGDYEILSILGVGGMGKVYKVRNVISDRVEAMKILLPDLSSNQGLADRFLREIRLLATLNHPNIAALRTALTHGNQLVMIMEFVEGETLANRLARAPLSTAEAVNYAGQILSALSYAHKQNIIHRDIKPANMMLTSEGVVKLMDFGIARSSTDGSLTSSGTTLGSLNYMPPEQVRGEAADARSDIYSFGVSLYEMLTGRLPFRGDSQYSLMTAHLNQEPQAPIELRSDLPAELNEIILMSIAKDPANRFQSADAFRAALKSVPVSALPAAGTTVTGTPRPSTGATTLMDTQKLARIGTVPTPAPARTPPPVPTMPVPAPQPPAGAVPPPSMPSATSRRGLWLAIGALIGVSVLVAGGVYIPRHVGTHADPNKAVFPQNSSSTGPSGSAENSQTAAGSDATANSSAPIVSMQSDKGSIAVDANGNVSMQSPQGSLQVDGKTGAVRMSDSSRATMAVSGKPKGTAASRGNPVAAGAQGAQADSASPVTPGPSPEELAKMEDDADKLNIRASTVSHSLDTLRQQQNAAGYSLRADVASAQERMQAYLAKGNAALAAKDMVNAQKYFNLADTEISK
ncbi:MAG TPA: serine/threonine-protein kinase, partial [Candidatus Acidoferrum sp.]|nr:serine/threonine-protein kinase [Candidatus Acidoferrum sp.]